MQFITGNKFKLISDFILDQEGFRKTNVNNSIPIFFIKTDYLNLFFKEHLPNNPFKIITHNSDYSIDNKNEKYLENENLISWYGQNINFLHPKLKSIPIGIANETYSHGDELILKSVISNNNSKENLIYCNFDIKTNFSERSKCLTSMIKNKIVIQQKTNFENYLNDLSKSFFSISPNGNGIDCHKTWESLYLKTIPVVTKSINSNFYENLPIYFINDWESFDSTILTQNLYHRLLENFDLQKISFNYFHEQILNNNI